MNTTPETQGDIIIDAGLTFCDLPAGWIQSALFSRLVGEYGGTAITAAETSASLKFADSHASHAFASRLQQEYSPTPAARCPNDTDGDGDCHLCYRNGGCPHT